MKLLGTILLCFFVIPCVFCQAQYQIIQDEKHPQQHILQGCINKYVIQNDTSYVGWYKNSAGSYKTDTAIVSAFAKAKNKVQFIIFGGTWCEDTQFILPKFFALQEMADLPDTAITFFGVDRAKKSLSYIADAFKIKNVPTIIVMKEGKEMGRVIEYGKTGHWDKELADIINN